MKMKKKVFSSKNFHLLIKGFFKTIICSIIEIERDREKERQRDRETERQRDRERKNIH
jgi:hypothetical protein